MTPIHVIIASLKGLPLHVQIDRLRPYVAAEKPRSGRRIELEALLRELVTKQIKREDRAA